MIIGHQRQKNLLSGMAASKNIPHAMLFEGLSKLGKRTLAISFIKTIFCENKNDYGKLAGSACGKCRSCVDVEKGNHPDLFLIFPQGKEIQISQIRELSQKFSFKPYSSHFKATIINDAHLMNQESQNSILKILEEPRGDSIMILVTDYPEALFATVRSRSQRIKFFSVSTKEIESYLRFHGCEGKELENILLFSFGRPGVALDFLLNSEKINFRKDKIKELLSIISADSSFYTKFKYAKDLADNSEKARELLEVWLSYFRALMLQKAKGTEEIKYSFLKIKKSLESIENSLYLISRTNANTKMVLETLIMEL